MVNKLCLKCKKVLRSENLSGYCNFHRHLSKGYKKSHRKYLKKWRKKNREKYLAYQRGYRLKRNSLSKS
jgi:hypothetical protein